MENVCSQFPSLRHLPAETMGLPLGFGEGCAQCPQTSLQKRHKARGLATTMTAAPRLRRTSGLRHEMIRPTAEPGRTERKYRDREGRHDGQAQGGQGNAAREVDGTIKAVDRCNCHDCPPMCVPQWHGASFQVLNNQDLGKSRLAIVLPLLVRRIARRTIAAVNPVSQCHSAARPGRLDRHLILAGNPEHIACGGDGRP
jgi:hypothetical protein